MAMCGKWRGGPGRGRFAVARRGGGGGLPVASRVTAARDHELRGDTVPRFDDQSVIKPASVEVQCEGKVLLRKLSFSEFNSVPLCC